jgi:Helitron helicase-like domain at N-terminus
VLLLGTLSPVDIKHPICLYYADTKEKFNPELRSSDERFRLISRNPVAGARFFHFMVELFIKHVLGVGEKHPGIYGETSAYYGTVEQQGRLTLHLHLLLWIVSSLTPQEIRDRIMQPDSEFQSRLIDYLEGVHIGEFLTGKQADVTYRKDMKSIDRNYKDPTQVLPIPPPPRCIDHECSDCSRCQATKKWWSHYESTVDDILIRSNVHVCSGSIDMQDQNFANEKNKKKKNAPHTDAPGCKSNKWGTCKARFPRKIIPQTIVEAETGALIFKKREEWINTVTPVLTYLMQCNTDVTSLLSGTAIKAVIAYVSDYITKSSLKTYMLFDTIQSVFRKNADFLKGDTQRKEKARKLMTQVVNSLTSRLEMGGPMVCLYLLGNPDHYTNGQFRAFYWKSYVREVRKAWDQDNDEVAEKVVLIKKKKENLLAFLKY